MLSYKNLYSQINEVNIADFVQQIQPCKCQQGQPNVVQPNSNVGEFGNEPSVESVEITKTENGDIKVKSGALCVKLSKCVMMALKRFMEMNGGE